MTKRIVAAIIMVMMIATMATVVNAEIVTDKVYYVTVSDRSQTKLRMAQINAFPYTISGATDYSTLFVSWHTAQVIQDNTIVVAQLVIDNLRDYSSTPFQIGVGQLATGAITNANSGAFYYDMPYDQEIISTTIAKIGDGTRITVTFKANGFTNTYPFIRIYPIIREEMGHVLSGVRYDLYQSVEEAAGSGVTPEEMKEVLSEWTEEELGPTIKDNVQEGVQAGMEEALENEKEQAHGGASGSIDDVTGALEGVTADMEEVAEKVEEFIHSFAYQGTSALITFPALDVPVLGHISDAITIDMAQKATEMIPSALLLMLRVATSLGLVLYPVWQTIKLFKELFDVYGGV